MGFKSILELGVVYLSLTVIHFFQFVLAITVIGLYGTDLQRAREADSYVDAKWVYAVVVGALSALTALLFMVPFILRFAFTFVWDFVLFVLWLVAFGIFGHMFINENAEGDGAIERMKNAVWVLLANALLWLITAIFMGIYWFRHRERHSRFTGRARV
ncbi:hypothetical protein BN1723_005650 [Verticillium longisporum]|uniref:MARVEL domain-containing protein n=1 Tax=Verticillium longisporum TaxID=100787 RepID=A0A0G4NAC5_VERLO|nr:hypothetical protein BN1723_005650 [Verticillium longisporum]